jgi:hypothetical protein
MAFSAYYPRMRDSYDPLYLGPLLALPFRHDLMT